MNQIFIAEIKTKSPFGFNSEHSWDELFALANKYGDFIAVHTNPEWDGSMELIKKARSLTKKPILAKGLHYSDDEVKDALKAGADYVLTVGRISQKYIDKTIFEPLTLDQLFLPKYIYPNLKVLWNSRDLISGKPKDAPSVWHVRNSISNWLCQASGIETMDAVNKNAEAYIVGEKLPEFIHGLYP